MQKSPMILESQVAALCKGESVADSEALREQIADFGLEYSTLDGQLTLASSLELLDAKTIADQLNAEVHALASRIDIHLSIDSTNSYLMSRTSSDDFHGSICLAEMQSAGRGRRGRNWVSPFGKNIYLSLGWQIPEKTSGVSGLSLVVGMQVVESLRSIGLAEVGLKWPNDILYRQGKLSGILVEMAAPVQGVRSLVIGIGVNLAISQKDAASIDQSWSALGQDRVSRNSLVAKLIGNVFEGLNRFSSLGFSAFQSQWREYNVYQDQRVSIHMGDKIIKGIDRGIDAEGNIRLETELGITTYNAGEVSLRPD